MILAMDFGGSSVKYALVDRDGEIRSSGRAAAPRESEEKFLGTVERIYRRCPDAEGLAISIPGYVDADTGVLIGSGAYSCLYGRNIAELARSRTGLDTAVENDGHCGALAELWLGSLAGCEDGVVLILGSGVAGGAVQTGVGAAVSAGVGVSVWVGSGITTSTSSSARMGSSSAMGPI